MNEANQTALALTAVQLSGAVSLPILLAGYYVGANYESSIGLLLIAAGNFILLTLALIYTQIGYHYQCITVELVAKFFGARGMLLCGISLLVLLLGWSVIQYHFIGALLQAMLGITQIKFTFFLAFITAIITYLAICHGLNRFAIINKILIPGLLVVLYFALNHASTATHTNAYTHALPAMMGVIMIVTTAGGLVFDCPTYYRHATSLTALRISLALLFVLIIPAIELTGFYLAKYSALEFADNSISNLLRQFDVAGLLFLCASSILSNCLNLYSATLVAKYFVRITYKKLLLVFCLLSALLSIINISNVLVAYLEVINCLAGCILLMVVTERLLQGLNLNNLSAVEQRRHEYLLYITIASAVLLQWIPVVKHYGLFATTCLVAMFAMAAYCQTRRFLCVNLPLKI